MDAALIARFESKFIKGPKNECWEWQAARRSSGYGQLAAGWHKNPYVASRLSYEIYKGLIPTGLCVCHSCDNPTCVNPNHLFLGTHQENMADMTQKGRAVVPCLRGEKNPANKLTEEQVLTIYAATGKHEHIAQQFGISQVTVSKIKRKETWEYLWK